MKNISYFPIMYFFILEACISCSGGNSLNKEVINRFNVYLINHDIVSEQNAILFYFPPSTCEPCVNSTNTLIEFLNMDTDNKLAKILISYPTSESLLIKPTYLKHYSANYEDFERSGLNLSSPFIIFVSNRNITYLKSINDNNIKLIQKRILKFIHYSQRHS